MKFLPTKAKTCKVFCVYFFDIGLKTSATA